MRWLVLAGIALLILTAGNLPLAALGVAVILMIAYWQSLERRPFRPCRKCNGTGRHRGALFTYAHRACPSCGGSSRHRRWGVNQFYGNRPTRAERAATEAGQRRSRPR